MNVDRPTLPAEGNVTVETTEPITAGTDAVTSGTAAVETSTSGGTRDSPTGVCEGGGREGGGRKGGRGEGGRKGGRGGGGGEEGRGGEREEEVYIYFLWLALDEEEAPN